MSFIFKLVDKTGRNIHLTKERWAHITSPNSLHPYMTNYIEEIKQALINPAFISPHSLEDKKADYYFFLKNEKNYLLVGVKYLNGDGFVTTAFITRKLIKRP